MPVADYPWERPLGAIPLGDGTVGFRVWAPRAEAVAVRLGRDDHPLADEGFGMRSTRVQAAAGDDYWFVLDGKRLPDPCSRWQPKGLRGPSRVVDSSAFAWSDAGWRGVARRDLVLYELHVGTFTPQGTFDAAVEHLPGLAELGVTAIEVMPVAEFPGARGWGYDGVYLSAAQSSYGGPEGFQRLVDAAHAAGLAVVLDVVYNHLGVSGVKAMEAFGPYFTDKYETGWGKAINYDDSGCDPVREWVLQSAQGWVRDFHVDGLRLDAVHAIVDQGARPLLRELADRVHALGEHVVVITESGLNDPKVTRPAAQGGWGHDAVWADDFHHALRTLLTGDREGYYAEFGSVADLAKAYRRPFVHDGQYSAFRGKRFGARAFDRPVEEFVVFDQNHDQVGNRALGDRLPTDVRRLAAFCVLLSPFVPMLFMGEEHGEQAPFLFFSDHIDKRIATATRDGRRREFAAFAAFSGEEVPDPQALETFEASKLQRRGDDPGLREFYAALLRVRRELPAGDVDQVWAFDDMGGPQLAVRRGPYTLFMNFADGPVSRNVAPDAAEVVLSTHEARIEGNRVWVPALAGALVR